jgi:nicotinic acid phosphoribosyltransferase
VQGAFGLHHGMVRLMESDGLFSETPIPLARKHRLQIRPFGYGDNLSARSSSTSFTADADTCAPALAEMSQGKLNELTVHLLDA